MKQKEKESSSLRDYWIKRLECEEDAHKDYRKAAKDAVSAYRDKDEKIEFPVFWSTIQITLAAIYAREPKPDVRKRNSQDPKSADNIAQAIEKAIAFYQDTEDYHRALRPSAEDMLITGLGQARVELDTETMQVPVLDPMTQQPIIGPDMDPVTEEAIKKQAVRVTHWPWSLFRWEPAASWERVTWVSFDHELTAEEIEKQFGVKVRDSTSTKNGMGSGDNKTTVEKYGTTHRVHEIWDKETRRRIFVAECCEKELEVDAVPLELDGFWPCPPPMLIGAPTDDYVPAPDYQKIKRQCEFIDDLSKRIKTLAKGIRNVGFYDASFSELGQIESASDTVYYPVKNLMDRTDSANSGGRALGGVLIEVDNQAKAAVLAQVIQQRELAKNELFETLGIADIIRGATQSEETATAQQLKGQWANVRIGPKIQAVNYFIRNLLRIVAEVICKNLDDAQLIQASGVRLTPEEVEGMRSESRVYTVDIETDATLAQDEQAEKTQRLEVLKTATEYMQTLGPAVQQNLLPADVAKEFLLFAVASFKYGRQLQDVIQQLPDQQQQLAKAQQQIQQLTEQGQQSAQQLQQAQQQLAKFSEGQEQRETLIAQADVQLKGAQAQKTMAEAQTVGITEPPMVEDKSAENALKLAQARKAEAETIRIAVETELLPVKMQQEQARAETEISLKRESSQADREDRQERRQMDREAIATGAPKARRKRVRATYGGEPIEMEIDED